MRTQIRNIGGSLGVFLPKKILKESGINNEVDLTFVKDKIVITSIYEPRKGWDVQIRNVAGTKLEKQTIPEVFEDDDFADWSW